jgi:uncharacterized membrane protein
MTKKHFEYNESKNYQSTTTDVSRKDLKKSVSPSFTWFWMIVVFMIITTITIFVIPDGFYPLTYVRLIFGAIFILFIPGFCLINLLFPHKLPFKASSENLGKVERFVLSVGTSITIVPVVALLLNYTHWGIRLVSVMTSLVVLTIVFVLVALIRDYCCLRKSKYQTSV